MLHCVFGGDGDKEAPMPRQEASSQIFRERIIWYPINILCHRDRERASEENSYCVVSKADVEKAGQSPLRPERILADPKRLTVGLEVPANLRNQFQG